MVASSADDEANPGAPDANERTAGATRAFQQALNCSLNRTTQRDQTRSPEGKQLDDGIDDTLVSVDWQPIRPDAGLDLATPDAMVSINTIVQ
jgi:hypothetical protein